MSLEYKIPCGRVLGHGEYCDKHGLCVACKTVDDLRRWKQECLAVESCWDVQAVGQLIGVPLGGDIRSAIQPAIETLRTENNRLRAALTKLSRFDFATDEKIAIAREALGDGK